MNPVTLRMDFIPFEMDFISFEMVFIPFEKVFISFEKVFIRIVTVFIRVVTVFIRIVTVFIRIVTVFIRYVKVFTFSGDAPDFFRLLSSVEISGSLFILSLFLRIYTFSFGLQTWDDGSRLFRQPHVKRNDMVIFRQLLSFVFSFHASIPSGVLMRTGR
jgi:hypothetical protein